MKSKIKFLFVALLAILAISCSESNIGPTVTPPSWKGFNYAVKRAIDGGQAGEYEQKERGALLPGDEIIFEMILRYRQISERSFCLYIFHLL